MNKKSRLGFLAVLVMAMGVGGCSTTDNAEVGMDGPGVYDPFEETNRAVFAFNTAVDNAFIHPLVLGYRAITPAPARTGLRNFLRNLKSPVTFANQVLQGDAEGAKNVLLRTTINTLVGGFGLFDVAGAEGIEYEPEDFGQTLAVWGVDHGPFLALPFFGVSSTRDYAGTVVDIVGDPLNIYLMNVDKEALVYYRAGFTYLELRDSLYDVLEDLEGNSIDYYASVRSTYYQRREAMVSDIGEGLASDTSDFDDIY